MNKKTVYVWLNINYGYNYSDFTQTFLQVKIKDNDDFESVEKAILQDGSKWTQNACLNSLIFGAKYKDHELDFSKFDEHKLEKMIIKKWNKRFAPDVFEAQED
jgi:hypothetical protein